MSLGSTFVQTLVTPSHPGSTPGTPLPWRWKWGYLRRQRVPKTAAVADGGAALACFLSGHFLPRWDWGYLEGQDPIPGGAEEAAASPFPTLGNASHPFHPTPGQLPPVRLRVGGGAHGKASLGNVVWIILRGLDPTPPPAPPPGLLQRKFCLFRKGPYSSQKFLTLIIRYPPTPLTGFQRKCGPRSGQERRRRGGKSRILRT